MNQGLDPGKQQVEHNTEKRKGSKPNNKFIQISSSFKKDINLSEEMDDYQSHDDDKLEGIVETVNDENSQNESC